VREQNISLRLFAGVVDHHIDRVPRLHGYLTAGTLKLFNGNQSFGFVTEIDNHVFGGNSYYLSLQNFVRGGRRKMAIVVEQILVVVGDFLVGWFVVRVYGH
jgi:hypothetical protein